MTGTIFGSKKLLERWHQCIEKEGECTGGVNTYLIVWIFFINNWQAMQIRVILLLNTVNSPLHCNRCLKILKNQIGEDSEVSGRFSEHERQVNKSKGQKAIPSIII